MCVGIIYGLSQYDMRPATDYLAHRLRNIYTLSHPAAEATDKTCIPVDYDSGVVVGKAK